MKQQTFTNVEYFRRKKKTRREEFLDTMNQEMPGEKPEEWRGKRF